MNPAQTIRAPSITANLFPRWLMPSLADVFFVMVIAWSFLTSPVGWLALLMDGDTGFHIRVGDWILATHRIPVQHPFSFAAPGREWFAFEWLSQLTHSLLHTAWGLKGVTLAAALVIGLVFTILFRYVVWRGAHPVIGLVTVLLAVSAARVHFWARPHLFTWIFTVVAVWLLERDRRQPGRALWVLIPLAALWANLHGGFVFLIVLIGLRAAGFAAEGYLWPPQRKEALIAARRCSVLALACLLASGLNPYGFRLHSHVADVLSAKWVTDIVAEFKSPSFRTEPLLAFMLLLFLAVGLTSRLLAGRRLADALWIFFLAYSALISVRHVPLFALVAAPIVAVELSGLWRDYVARAPARGSVRILDEAGAQFTPSAARNSLWALAFVAWLAFAPGFAWPKDFPSDLFPTGMVARHRYDLARARVFTTDQWADYLVYTNYPRQHDFIDGQHQYFGESLMRPFVGTFDGAPGWNALLNRFHFDYVLCPSGTTLAALLRTSPSWHELDESPSAVLFQAASR